MAEPRPESESLAPLPKGRHGLPPEEVAANQRARIAAAIAKLIAEQGRDGFTVERVIDIAGVSRSTFYHHFADKREALMAAHDLLFEDFLAMVKSACLGQDEWPGKVAAAIAAAFEFAARRPEQIQFLSSASLTADAALAGRITESHRRLADLLGGIRQNSPYAPELPACTEQFQIAGIGWILSTGRAREGFDDPAALQRELVELTLLPYYGAAEAARLARERG